MQLSQKLLISAIVVMLMVSGTSSLSARDISPKEYEIFAAENLRADFNKLPADVQNKIRQDYDRQIKLATLIRQQHASEPIFQAALDFRALDLWSNRIASKVDIGDEKLKELYGKQDLSVAPKYKLRNILVKTDEEASAIVAELSKYTGDELQNRFIALVKEKSIDPATKGKDGDSGWVDVSTMPKEVIDRVQGASKLSFVRLPSIPDLGIHILLIEDMQPEHKASFEEGKQFLAKMLIQNEIAKEAKALLEKENVPSKSKPQKTKK